MCPMKWRRRMESTINSLITSVRLPFDPRLMEVVSAAVAKRDSSGVAKAPIKDFAAYTLSLSAA
jgi:hypothetical protein